MILLIECCSTHLGQGISKSPTSIQPISFQWTRTCREAIYILSVRLHCREGAVYQPWGPDCIEHASLLTPTSNSRAIDC